MKKTADILLLIIAVLLAGHMLAQPFTVKADLFDQTIPDDLGLSTATDTETYTVYKPSSSSDHYSNAAVMTAFKGYLYCQWQSSATNEDSQDTWVAYSRSSDMKTWTAPMHLTAGSATKITTSGGWWVNGDTLVAYINVWPNGLSPEGGNAYYTTSLDGITWSAMQAVKMKNGAAMAGVFEQDPHALPDGRIINAVHFQPGLQVCPVYTDDKSGVRGWVKAAFTPSTATAASTNEMEPSWYRRSDGAAVMIFRDQSSSYYKLASVSTDRGNSWTTPVKTDMPDSRSKQSAGNLPDGQAFMVNNPVLSKTRIPLVVTLSTDGSTFDKAYVLRKGGSDLQAQAYTGTAKGLGYSYPKSMVYNGYVYVAYSVNKEDVQFTRVPIAAIYPPKKGQIDVYESSAPDVWTNTANWTPQALPAAADTAVIRTGEAKLARDFAGYIKVEPNGILRATSYINLATVELRGGAIKLNTASQTSGMKLNLLVKEPSSVIAGTNPLTLFSIDGTIAGSANLTKKDLGIVKLKAAAADFKGIWIVENDTLTIASATGLGQCGATVNSAVLDIDAAASTYSLVLKKGCKLNLDANLTVQAAVFDNINLVAGTYRATDYPAFISGTGSLVVAKSLLCIGTPPAGGISLSSDAGTAYRWADGTADLASTSDFNPAATGSFTVQVANTAGCAITSAPVPVLGIALRHGWNLVSINVRPADSAIATLFKGLDAAEIKDMNSYWRKDQPSFLNYLQTIIPGEGYLVNMNTAGTLTVTGVPIVETHGRASLQTNGWQLIGCPYQTATGIAGILGSNFSEVKNFTGFWTQTGGVSNSIQKLEPGKGYFIKK